MEHVFSIIHAKRNQAASAPQSHESDDETHDPRGYPHIECGASGDRSLAELTRHGDGSVTERDDCIVGGLLGVDHVGPSRWGWRLSLVIS